MIMLALMTLQQLAQQQLQQVEPKADGTEGGGSHESAASVETVTLEAAAESMDTATL